MSSSCCSVPQLIQFPSVFPAYTWWHQGCDGPILHLRRIVVMIYLADIIGRAGKGHQNSVRVSTTLNTVCSRMQYSYSYPP